MRSYCFLLALLLLMSSSVCADTGETNMPEDLRTSAAQQRIVGGQEAQPGTWPWMAALVTPGFTLSSGFFCGATLIHPRWVMTTAHCVEGLSPGEIDVAMGCRDLSANTAERVRVKRIVIHPDYSGDFPDIALLELERDMGRPILPIYPGVESLAGHQGMVLGWGTKSESNPDLMSDTLQQVSVMIVSNETCNAAFAENDFSDDIIQDVEMCAGYPEGGMDACYGDSGGPLLVNDRGIWKQAGIVVWGDGCARAGTYGVYTRLSRLIGFINEYLTPGVSGVFNDGDGDTCYVSALPDRTVNIFLFGLIVFSLVFLCLNSRRKKAGKAVRSFFVK